MSGQVDERVAADTQADLRGMGRVPVGRWETITVRMVAPQLNERNVVQPA